jgi:hypothetical protein
MDKAAVQALEWIFCCGGRRWLAKFLADFR